MNYETDPDTVLDLTPNPDILQIDVQVDTNPPIVYINPADNADQN